MKIKYIKQLSAQLFILKGNVNAMASVKRGKILAGKMLCILPILGLHTTVSRVRSTFYFVSLVYTLIRNMGPKGACLMLKVYAVTLQQAIGGFKVKDITGLKFRCSRTNTGLPRVIPSIHRSLIRAGDTGLIRYYLSMFNLYRLMEFRGDFRFKSLTKTITDPAKTLVGHVELRLHMILYIPLFFKALARLIGMNPKALANELSREYGLLKPYPLLKSSPVTAAMPEGMENLTRLEAEELLDKTPVVSTHPLAVHEAAVALDKDPELRPAVLYFLELLPKDSVLKDLWRHCMLVTLDREKATNRQHNVALGKLSLKQEAAGKVRVFAMVDCWTQWLLKPLHSVIFDQILRGIPQDGTMNQLLPVHNLLQTKPTYLASLDLSAATDRLPLWLQKLILTYWLGQDFADAWANLLVGRDYSLTIPFQIGSLPTRYRVRYAVGQPMGALSSWAMLALTHHFIVQYCAWSVGVVKVGEWFTEYAVLGDDLVISNKVVAQKYISVMKVLGVGIGLHKSLLSTHGIALEFAKRTFYKGVDVSPVSLLEIQAAFSQPAAIASFARKYATPLPRLVKALGFGFRVLGSLNKPLGKLNSKLRLVILALNMPVTVEEIEAFFKLGAPKGVPRHVNEVKEVIDHFVSTELRKLKARLNEMRYELYSLEKPWLVAKYIANIMHARQGAQGGMGFNYVFGLTKLIVYNIQTGAKEVALAVTEQVSSQLVYVMLHRHDMTPAQLYESLIALHKALANVPVNSLTFKRVYSDETKGLTDTVHIRLWKSLSGVIQGTKRVVPSQFGFGIQW